MPDMSNASETLLREAVDRHRLGQLSAAEELYRAILLLVPENPDIHHSLGTALAQQGKLAEAAPYLMAALDGRPERPRYWKAALDVLQALGDREAMVRIYRRMLAQQPRLAQGHFVLGNLLRELNRLDEAEAAWMAALSVDPNFAKAHNNLGVLAKLRGDLSRAEVYFRAAISAAPAFAGASCNLGTVLEQKGMLNEAEQCFRRTITLDPAHADARRYLGAVLCELGRLEEALNVFMEHALRANGTQPGGNPRHRQVHDEEQRAWLGEPGRDLTRLSIVGGMRVPGGAVSCSGLAAAARTWDESDPHVVVIDDILTQEGLDALRQYCLGSAIWRQAFPGGYLGTLPEHGFAVPLLCQIGEELASALPSIFAGHPLLQLWAFKYDASSTGVGLHADFAAVNVNFWITPDNANRDPGHGGLVIWDKTAPLDWDFETYNNDERVIRDFLRRSEAKAITVPYRANRAVLFDSDLFHETDAINFHRGYENRRINVTLLYGWRGGVRKARI